MAQKITVELLDDIDGSEAVGTFEFTHKGVDYAIDLNQEHMDEYNQMFEYLTEIARVVRGKKRAPYGSKKGATPVVGKTQEMREWLRAAGHNVKDRGRVPGHLVDLWETRSRMPETAVEEPADKAPEQPAEAPKVEEAPKTTRKAPTPRKKAAPKPSAKTELAKLLTFEEPKKPTRTRAAKTSTNKV